MSLLSDLISYWKHDETSGTRVDSHDANDLTDNNTVGSVVGVINNAASFVAANGEYLSNASIDTDNASDYTISAWVYLPNNAPDFQCLANFRWDATEEGGWWCGFSADGKPAFFSMNGGFGGFTSTNAITQGSWHHVVFRLAAAGTVTIWVDNALWQSGTRARAANASTGFAIGRNFLNSSNPLQANVDEFGLWGRLLTDAEVGQLYNSGAGLAYPFGTGPTSIIPVAWLEGDGTYWQDSARTTPANADTDPIGSWDDASGAGQHATQATSGSRPTLQTAEVNGVSAVQFDGVDDLLTSAAAVADGTPVTVAAVFRLTGDGSFSYVIGDASSFRGIRVTSGRTISLCDGSQDVTSPTPIAGDWVLVVAILDGTNATLRVNGVQVATAASTVTGWIGGFTIGGRGTGSSFQACEVADPLLYDSGLTGTDLTNVEDYLTAKYFAAGGGTTVTPGTAPLSLTSFAPTVSTPRTVTPSTVALSLTSFAPVVSTPRLVTPGVAALSIGTFAPTITTPRTVTPGAASLTLSTFAPSVTASSGLTLVPGTASLTLATFAPTVSTPRVVTPGTASLSISSFAPGVVIGIVATPDPVALTLSTFAPVVQTPRVVTPGVVSLTLSTFAPNVAIAGAATIPVAARWIATGTARRWITNGKVRRWVAGRNQMVKNTITKTPGDALIRLEMDFSDLPELDSATIASVTSVAGSPSGLTIASEQVESGDKAASAVFSGGTNGTDYEVTFTVLLSSGETLARTGLLRVRTR